MNVYNKRVEFWNLDDLYAMTCTQKRYFWEYDFVDILQIKWHLIFGLGSKKVEKVLKVFKSQTQKNV